MQNNSNQQAMNLNYFLTKKKTLVQFKILPFFNLKELIKYTLISKNFRNLIDPKKAFLIY